MKNKYPAGREVVCKNTYNPRMSMYDNQSSESDVIIFQGEHAEITYCAKPGFIKLIIERLHRDNKNEVFEHYISECAIDAHWDLVP